MELTGVDEAVDELRRSVADRAESELFTRAAVSVHLPDSDVVVLKPAGVSRDDLSADSVVVTDMSGKVLDGGLAPWSGGDTHVDVHREMPEVQVIVNTRSTLVMAAAARGEPVPPLPVDAAGGRIPVAPGGSGSGEDIVGTLRSGSSPAVLMRGHGLFTVGSSAGEAVKAAVLLERRIRTIHLGRQLGTAEPLDPQDVDWLRR
ncbi:class II aldolase/adducin family protein [Kribbella sp. NPDC026611]|uniref:class II aldolase/adducin family protein n=1 Tax=Kribbella sp. NPDC026611 TaxID=3154911 RepID=UPI0033FDFD13